jgi:hypothetical protein
MKYLFRQCQQGDFKYCQRKSRHTQFAMIAGPPEHIAYTESHFSVNEEPRFFVGLLGQQ